MNFLFKFMEKPNNATKKIAVQIAKECKYELKDGIYYVYFDEINLKLKKLLYLTCRWTNTEFIVDQGKADSLKVYDIFFCPYRETCGGICQKVELIPRYKISSFISRLNDFCRFGFSIWHEESQFVEYGYIQKTDDPRIYLINKRIIIDEVKKQLNYPLVYCDKLEEKKCLELIDSLPETINIEFQGEAKIHNDDTDNNDFEMKFTGFSEALIDEMKAEANIKAPIYAKAIAKELEELLKKTKS